MKFSLYNIGKTDTDYLQKGIMDYSGRISHFYSFEVKYLPVIKKSASMPMQVLLQKETELLKKALVNEDVVILLDERGKEYSSRSFALWIEKRMNQSVRSIAFVTGGAFGFSEEIKELADYKISLSRLTFTHQMVRLIFVEQFYRACTIIRGMKYHND